MVILLGRVERGSFVQIMNVGLHRVTLSNINSGPEEMQIYNLNYSINEQAQGTIPRAVDKFRDPRPRAPMLC